MLDLPSTLLIARAVQPQIFSSPVDIPWINLIGLQLAAFQAPSTPDIQGSLPMATPKPKHPTASPHVYPPWSPGLSSMGITNGIVGQGVSPLSSVPASSLQAGPRWAQPHFPAACCKEHSRFLTSLLVCWFISNTVTPLYSDRLVKSGLHIAVSRVLRPRCRCDKTRLHSDRKMC